MSRNYNGIPVFPYIGKPYGVSITLCDRPVKCVPLLLQWLVYNASSAVPDVGVGVNLESQTQAGSSPIKRIASCYIDNTQSRVPITIFFPDIKFAATVQPFASAYIPVFTGQLQCVIFGQDFVTGQIPETNVFLMEDYVPGFVSIERQYVYNQYLSSKTIPTENILSDGFNSPALGDQTISGTYNNNIVPGQNLLLGQVFAITPGKVLTITNLYMRLTGVEVGGSSNDIASLTLWFDKAATRYFESTISIFDNHDVDVIEVLNIQGSQVKMLLDQVLNARVSCANRRGTVPNILSTISFTMVYTLSDTYQ
jgi:hypothetical protein